MELSGTLNKFVLFLFLTILSIPDSYSANDEQDETKAPFRVPRVNSDIIVDAYLTESFWQEAVKINANIEVTPGENIKAPVKTEVLIANDEENLFVAFIAYDPNPEEIQAHFCDRDDIWDDDWILILFDTFNDQRRTYDFACNPLGIQCDFIETTTGDGGEWDAIWESDGRITNEGFIVEMSIPFSSLNFPDTDEDQIWGFDAVRSYPRNVRHHIGSFPRDRNNNCYMCQAEKLIGFKGVTPGNNIQLSPTFNVVIPQERENETSGKFVDGEKKYEPGLTANWGFTPNLNLSTTINPDFSNIEADILQLDINNQFAIYYPEKRPFFLENSDFFSTPLSMVHTRTLADPEWGVKLSGKEGIHSIGYFTVQDAITNFIFPGPEGSESESMNKKSFGSALRYKADISKSSNVGVLFTDREGDKYHNRLAGIDGDFKFTQTDRIRFQALGSKTKYPGSITGGDYSQPVDDFNGHAYYIRYSHDTREYNIYGVHNEIDENMRADLGFITRAGYRYTEIGGQYKWRREPGHWYNWLSVSGSFDYRRDQNEQLQHRVFSGSVYYEGPLQSHINIYGETGKDRYNNKYFNLTWVNGCMGLRITPPLFVHLYWRYGDQIDYSNTSLGSVYQLSPSITWNIGLHLKVNLDYIYEQLDVTTGKLYSANIGRVKLVYQVNKQIFIRGIVQYVNYRRNVALYEDDVESETKSIFSQFLFSYKINPQTVFFLGYADDYYGDADIKFLQTHRTLFAKIGYALIL